MNDNKVQKLSDEALDEVAGGAYNPYDVRDSDIHVFAVEFAPMVLDKCKEVRAGKDRTVAWNELIQVLEPLIRARIPFSADHYLKGGYLEEYFNMNCK